MSKGRLNDLRDALQAEGWVLLDPQAMYTLENEVVSWAIEHSRTKRVAYIDFHAFGDLGERTDSLTDILYGLLRERGIKLYFEKRESEKWRHSLIEFVKALRSAFANAEKDN